MIPGVAKEGVQQGRKHVRSADYEEIWQFWAIFLRISIKKLLMTPQDCLPVLVHQVL